MARSMLIRDFAREYYLPHVLVNTTTGRSRYAIFKNHIEPNFGALNFRDLSRIKIHDWRNSLIIRGYKPAMINKIQVIFGQIIDLAKDLSVNHDIDRSYLGFRTLRVIPHHDTCLSANQMDRLRSECKKSSNKNLFHIVILLALTGARKREILDARWCDIDLEKRIILVPKSKNGFSRRVFLNDGALTIINSCKLTKNPNGYVFTNPKTGKPYSCIYHSWNLARKNADLPSLRIHDLRHSFASALVNQGISIYDVQHLLGHQSIKTTQRYAHLNDQTLLKSAHSAHQYYSQDRQ